MKPETERFNFNDPSWQVVRREFPCRKDSITITFLPERNGGLQISEPALKALGNPAYGQLLINPKTHKLALMGTNTKMANSIRLPSQNSESADDYIPCEEFINRLWRLMEWTPGNKYVVRGRLTKKKPFNNGPILVFNLENSCMFAKMTKKEAKQRERGRILAADYSERLGHGIRPAELLQGEGNPIL